MRKIALFVVLAAALGAAAASAREFSVSPTGGASGDGSRDRPWDLATALAAKNVRPGDTVWLRGGTYRGKFTSMLRGTAEAPITVRGVAGGRATIDGELHLAGAYTWFRDLEATSSAPERASRETGPYPKDISRGIVTTVEGPETGAGLKLIDVVAHDLGSVCLWKEAIDMEVSGCLIYGNGWNAPDRGHGHGIYVQNARGTKRIDENVIFENFDNGIQAYGSRKANLDNLEIVGNTIFENGAPVGDPANNILVGGGSVAKNTRIADNFLYYAAFGRGTQINLGYDPYGVGAEDAVVSGNYIGNGEVRMNAKNRDVTFSENTVISAPAGFSPAQFSGNRYAERPPTTNAVFVRPSRYTKGRATVTVFNWRKDPWVAVDLSGAVPKGAAYEIRRAQDFYGPPVASGTYGGGTVRLPMRSAPSVQPVGWKRPPPTTPEFDVFIVLPAVARASGTGGASPARRRP